MAYDLVSASSQRLRASNPLTGLPFTFAGWVNYNASQNSVLIGTASTTQSTNYIYLGVDSSFRVYSRFTTSNTPTLTAGTWNHLAATFSSSAGETFLNGASVRTSAGGTYFASMDRLSVGCVDRAVATLFTDGQVAECGVWNAILSAAEIASLAKGFTPDQVNPQALIYYVPLVKDLTEVRGGRTITNVNSATVATHPRIIT
ncbi:MAG: LamG-like jellyroll fold domain-containing protein [Vulcanococcus sp.]